MSTVFDGSVSLEVKLRGEDAKEFRDLVIRVTQVVTDIQRWKPTSEATIAWQKSIVADIDAALQDACTVNLLDLTYAAEQEARVVDVDVS
jgi:hypothetical protein